MAAAFFQNKYSTEGSHQVALLPVIDLLNHNSTNQVRLHPFVSYTMVLAGQQAAHMLSVAHTHCRTCVSIQTAGNTSMLPACRKRRDRKQEFVFYSLQTFA